MKALITGASGFLGTHLARELKGHGWNVIGFSRTRGESDFDAYHIGSVLSEADLKACLQHAQPDAIFHLAGMKQGSFKELLQIHATGTAALFDAIEASGRFPWVMIAGSAAEYGLFPHDGSAVDETHPLRPQTSYGVSKETQERVGIFLAGKLRIPLAVVRTFNLVGPDEPETSVCGSFARQMFAPVPPAKIVTQSLDASRDFVDVRDACRAYRLLATQRTTGVFNVCSGTSVRIRDVLEFLMKRSGRNYEVESPSGLDVSNVRGNAQKLFSETGWTPTLTLERSLEDLASNLQRTLSP